MSETNEASPANTERGLQRLVRVRDKFLCRIGFHKWGEAYVTAGHDAWFGMGHHAQDCKRHGCKMILRHAP